MTTLLLAVAVATAIPAPTQDAAATAVAPRALTEADAVRAALRSSPRLRAAAHDIAAAEAGLRGSGALANPHAAFTPSLTGGVGGGSDTELLIQQPLEIGGTRAARRGSARARRDLARAQERVARREVAFEARTAYLELVRAREQAALARELHRTAEELDRIARRQVELGSRPAIEQVQTAIETARARQQVTLSRTAVARQEAALNALWNLPPAAPVGPVSLENAPAAIPAAEEAERLALARRAELAAGAAAVAEQEQEARLARAEGRPDLTPQFRATSVTRGGGVRQSGFGLGISLPLIDWGGRRGRVRAAEQSARAGEERLDALRARIRQEAAQAVARESAAREVLAAYPEGILPQARCLLAASRVGYEEGHTTVVQLIEAQRTYRQVQSDHINARVDAALARAELDRATEAPLSEAEGGERP